MAEANIDEVELEEQVVIQGDGNVKVALVGATGSGKSSFINAMRGLRNDDKTAAKTGVTNTTAKPGCYPLPNKPNFQLWDLPGHSTPDDLINYCKKSQLQLYDAFLLFVEARFTKMDMHLAKYIASMKKPFFIIRAKIDADIRAEEEKETFKEDEMLKTIRESILKIVKAMCCSGEDVFLISNDLRNKWDFRRLADERLYELCSRASESCFVKKPSQVMKHAKHKDVNFDEKLRLNSLKRDWNGTMKIIKQGGIKAVQKVIQEEHDRMNETEISLAIIGDSGVGKSSFINAIRGLKDDDEGAAATGVTETTMASSKYAYPFNENITLWDQPGIGTETFPDLKTYCKRINIRKYDVFIIMAAGRFTMNDAALAKKLVTINKPFFFVRTKIDVDYNNEKSKDSFREETMLREIRDDCVRNIRNHLRNDDLIFLISNKHQRKFDFGRLTEAILERLPQHKQESFKLSMHILSEDILKRKVKTLKGRIWMAVIPSIIVKALPGTKSYSRKLDYGIIIRKMQFYRSQLGFPDKDSERFKEMKKELQVRVQKFDVCNEDEAKAQLPMLEQFDGKIDNEEGAVLAVQVIKSPFKSVYISLYRALDEMEEIALEILNKTTDVDIE